MARYGRVHVNGLVAGILEDGDSGYRFVYDPAYLSADMPPVCLSMPTRTEPFVSETLFAFFYGLLAEGETKNIQCRKLRLDPDDHFGRLLKTAHGDTIGNVTVEELPAE